MGTLGDTSRNFQARKTLQFYIKAVTSIEGPNRNVKFVELVFETPDELRELEQALKDFRRENPKG